MSSSSAFSEVEPSVWRAVAGASVQIPSVNSFVYYFPEGHLEHSRTSQQNYDITLRRSMIPCQVLSVRYLSNLSSDQAFVKILLQPLHAGAVRPAGNGGDKDHGQNDVVAFAKILTPSDANNGGGFSVPRFCADSIFPRLDFAADPPVQNLTMRDTHSNAWEFRHIYRGTPRRHLLTTGWSKFVNGKRLVAGDSVVFMRRKPDELFIGIRRAARFAGPRGWETAESFTAGDVSEAVQAMESAGDGTAFEVVYYPRVGVADFVVSMEKVDESLRAFWNAGMRVRMPVETEDLSRMTWFQGTVESATVPEGGSPWRMLKVTWDEPEVLLNMTRVSPWQVELVHPTLQPDSPFPSPKRPRVLQNTDLIGSFHDQFRFSMAQSMVAAGHLNPAALNYPPLIPGGCIQGPRQGKIYSSNVSNSLLENMPRTFTELLNHELEPELKTVSTVLNIGSSHSENLSPGSQNSVHFGGTDLNGQQGHVFRDVRGSFQLFGKVIEVVPPVEGRIEPDNSLNHNFNPLPR